jgi:hypothetical protein
MRALGLGTKIAAACAAAAALIVSLGLPWYGAIPEGRSEYRTGDIAGPLDGLFDAIPRWLGAEDGTTAWDLAGHWDMALGGAAVLALLAALLCSLAATEYAGRALLQLSALAAFGLSAVKLFVRPDGMEPRYGILVAVGVSGLLVIISAGIAAAKLRRKPLPPRRYTGSAAPRPYEHAGSAPPPGP